MTLLAPRPTDTDLDQPQTSSPRGDLLRHYLDGAQQTVGSVDQLGNFLMGFGVLALGYLLNADLGLATSALGGAAHKVAGFLALGSWGLAVLLLVMFVWTYIFRVIAGREVHARDGREENVGEVIDLPSRLTYTDFRMHQGSFDEFLATHYTSRDRKDPERLLFVRWSYLRFMTLKKLEAMERMRGLLGFGLLFGVGFKLVLVYLQAFPA